MTDHKHALTKYIVEAAAQHPQGFTHVEAGHHATVQELVTEGLVQAAAPTAEGIPVKPTHKAISWINTPAEIPAVQSKPTLDPSKVKIESGIPVPDKKAFGRTSDGNDKVTQWGFGNLDVNQSFFIPQQPGADTPVHRSFSSVVSQANKKLFPRNFVIREWEGGARIWRVEDLTEARPTRARKSQRPEAVAQPQPFAAPQQSQQFPGGFAAPGHPGFGNAPQPFGAPGGFAPPPADLPFVQAGPGFGAAPGQETWGDAPEGDGPLPEFGA